MFGSKKLVSVGGSTADRNLPKERIDFHVRRFRLALDQCQKDDQRKKELRHWLQYWEAMQTAQNLKTQAEG